MPVRYEYLNPRQSDKPLYEVQLPDYFGDRVLSMLPPDRWAVMQTLQSKTAQWEYMKAIQVCISDDVEDESQKKAAAIALAETGYLRVLKEFNLEAHAREINERFETYMRSELEARFAMLPGELDESKQKKSVVPIPAAHLLDVWFDTNAALQKYDSEQKKPETPVELPKKPTTKSSKAA